MRFFVQKPIRGEVEKRRMPLYFKKGDIASARCDAIVVPTSHSMSVWSRRESVDSRIFSLADKKIKKELVMSGGCETGKAKIFPSFGLACKHLICTVGPKWRGGDYGEEGFLRSCYKESFILAKEAQCESVAFPLISSGAYGMPKEIAVSIAVSTLRELVADSDMSVYLVLYDTESVEVGKRHIEELSAAIGKPETEYEILSELLDGREFMESEFESRDDSFELCRYDISHREIFLNRYVPAPIRSESDDRESNIIRERGRLYEMENLSLEDELGMIDEGFSDMLVRKIAEKFAKNSDCYRKANVDKKLFSKIISNADYRPKKTTVLAFAIALELDIDETGEMLKRAGYALNTCHKLDIIVSYFIKKKHYNVFDINEALFAYDQPLLGSN